MWITSRTPYLEQAERIAAFREFIADVASNAYPQDQHVVKMNPGA